MRSIKIAYKIATFKLSTSNVTMHQLKPNKWLDNYGDYLYSFARSRVGTAETAEDLVQ